jgi:putative protease
MRLGERKSIQGGCAQACRWRYYLLEEKRPGELFEIEQDNRGTHIMSSKDLALVELIPQLIEAGVDSFKIEGRTKSLYYVSAVAKVYRAAIDGYFSGAFGKNDYKALFNELLKVGNRGYTTGFYLTPPGSDGYSYDISKGLAGSDFLCEFLAKEGNLYKVKIKNKVHLNDEIEIITPDEVFETKIIVIYNELKEEISLGNTNDEVFIELSVEPKNYKYALGRTTGIKNLR